MLSLRIPQFAQKESQESALTIQHRVDIVAFQLNKIAVMPTNLKLIASFVIS